MRLGASVFFILHSTIGYFVELVQNHKKQPRLGLFFMCGLRKQITRKGVAAQWFLHDPGRWKSWRWGHRRFRPRAVNNFWRFAAGRRRI